VSAKRDNRHGIFATDKRGMQRLYEQGEGELSKPEPKFWVLEKDSGAPRKEENGGRAHLPTFQEGGTENWRRATPTVEGDLIDDGRVNFKTEKSLDKKKNLAHLTRRDIPKRD